MQHVTFDAEIAKDPKFDEQLQGIIAEIEEVHKKNVEKYGAARLKATPLLNLMKQGRLTVDFLKAEFPKVANKQSQLPSSQRDIVSSIVFNAAQRTVLLKRAERARRIEEKANANVEAEQAGETTAQTKPKGSRRKAKKQAKKAKTTDS